MARVAVRLTTAFTTRNPSLDFRKPDHFENYDDWPFLWGQSEGTIAGNTLYLIFGSAFKALF